MSASILPIVRIVGSDFRRTQASEPILKALTLTIWPPDASRKVERWAVVGYGGKSTSTILQILQGKYECQPLGGRTYPALAAKRAWPDSCIGLVEFTGTGLLGERVRGDYMSSRYESRREATDITLREWLRRTADHLPMHTDNFDFTNAQTTKAAEASLEQVAEGLKLDRILDQPVSTLSNGQGRRARIAQALLRDLDLILLDEPFMGLDPSSTKLLSSLLDQISSGQKLNNHLTTQVVLGLRMNTPRPDWITHILYVNHNGTITEGPREDVEEKLVVDQLKGKDSKDILEKVYSTTKSRDRVLNNPKDNREVLIDVQDVRIAYRGKEILKDFSWKIRRGDRWGLFGPNGSGKTTVLSLITSDHPMSYSLPVKLFGRSRLPEPGEPGISIFDIQSRIGHTSPEIHQFFPKYRTLRQCVESAYADTFLSKPNFADRATSSINDIMEYFGISTDQQNLAFGEYPLSMQRLALFLRAVVKKPDLVIFDEAFSGMDHKMKEECMSWLTGDGLESRQALVCVSHVEDEIPKLLDRFVRLEEAGSGKPPIFELLGRPYVSRAAHKSRKQLNNKQMMGTT